MFTTLSRLLLTSTAVLTLAACGGGGGSTPSGTTPITQPTLAPVATSSAAATTLATAQISGALGFESPSTNHTVYIFDADLAAPGTSTCTAACASAWPPVAPPAATALTANFSTITRADGSTQLTYDNRPMYNFSGDTSAGTANGDGLNAFGGIWHVSRPQGSTVGTSPNPPGTPY